ncbi:hypothetical protein D9M73_149770 [compost metagenome]
MQLGAEVAVHAELGGDVFGIPFHFLGDVALDRGDLQRRAGRNGPGVALQRDAGDPRRQQQEQRGHQAYWRAQQFTGIANQRGAEGDGEGDQPDATHRRQPGQRAVQLAVAGVEPGEAGEEPAAEQFQPHPQGGEGQCIADRRAVAPQVAHPQPGRQGEEERHASAETTDQERRQRAGGTAEIVDAVVDPAGPGDECAEAVPPAAPERRVGRGVA